MEEMGAVKGLVYMMKSIRLRTERWGNTAEGEQGRQIIITLGTEGAG